MTMQLLAPDREHLPGYLDAVRHGWPGDRAIFGSVEALLALAAQDEQQVLARLADLAPGEIFLKDGSTAPRIPSLFRWMWDDDGFAGSIDLRWHPGTEELPDYMPGHIGYGTVEDRRGRGYATAALAHVLPLARAEGLAYVQLITASDNPASARVIELNGGVLVERFTQTPALGGGESCRWRIGL